ncbi:hypothetical protein Tcan_00927, partial [Toxocara canis]
LLPFFKVAVIITTLRGPTFVKIQSLHFPYVALAVVNTSLSSHYVNVTRLRDSSAINRPAPFVNPDTASPFTVQCYHNMRFNEANPQSWRFQEMPHLMKLAFVLNCEK